jgi:hypothetical protein
MDHEPIIYGAECSIALLDRKKKNTRFAILTPHRLVILSQFGWIPSLPSRSKTLMPEPHIQLPEDKVKLQPNANTIIINLVDIIKVEHANKRHVRGYVGGMSHLAIYFTVGAEVHKIELRTSTFWTLPYLVEMAFHRHLLTSLRCPPTVTTVDSYRELLMELHQYQELKYYSSEELERLGTICINLSAYSYHTLYKENFLSTGVLPLMSIMNTLIQLFTSSPPSDKNPSTHPGIEQSIDMIKSIPWKHRRKRTDLDIIPPIAPNYKQIHLQIRFDIILVWNQLLYTIKSFLQDYCPTKTIPIIPRNIIHLIKLILQWQAMPEPNTCKKTHQSFLHGKVLTLCIAVEYFFQAKFHSELVDSIETLFHGSESILGNTAIDLVCTWLELQETPTPLHEKVYSSAFFLFLMSKYLPSSLQKCAQDDVRYRLVPLLSYEPKNIPERECMVLLKYIASLF